MASTQFDPPSQSSDVAGEVAAARLSPIEIAQMFSNVVEPGGVTIPSPVWSLDPYVAYLAAQAATTVTFSGAGAPNFDYFPDLLSKYLYGTHDLWYILMELNKVSVRDDFVGPTFTVVAQASYPTLLRALRLANYAAALASQTVPNYGDLTIRQVPLSVAAA